MAELHNRRKGVTMSIHLAVFLMMLSFIGGAAYVLLIFHLLDKMAERIATRITTELHQGRC